MDNEEKIAKLEKEVYDLKKRVQDIFDALVLESKSTTATFKKVDKQFAAFDNFLVDIVDYLMPVVHKVFPGVARGKREIDSFLKRRPPSKTG